MHGQLVVAYNAAPHFINVRKVQPPRDAQGVQIERQVHQISISCALAMAEQTAFDAIGCGHQSQVDCGCRRISVI